MNSNWKYTHNDYSLVCFRFFYVENRQMFTYHSGQTERNEFCVHKAPKKDSLIERDGTIQLHVWFYRFRRLCLLSFFSVVFVLFHFVCAFSLAHRTRSINGMGFSHIQKRFRIVCAFACSPAFDSMLFCYHLFHSILFLLRQINTHNLSHGN